LIGVASAVTVLILAGGLCVICLIRRNRPAAVDMNSEEEEEERRQRKLERRETKRLEQESMDLQIQLEELLVLKKKLAMASPEH